MANSACMKELASRIWENAEHEIGGMGRCINVGGVPVTFPYQDVEQVPFNEQIPTGICASYLAMKDLHDPETMPAEWIKFIQKAGAVRERKGCNHPVNLIYAVHFVLEDFPVAAREENLFAFKALPEGSPDLSDGERVRDVVSSVLASPRLSALLVETLKSLIPDMPSGAFLNQDKAVEVIRDEGIQDGVLLNIGCGLGENTGEWGEKTGLKPVGFDRQYHPKWYKENWRDNKLGAQFARVDIAEALPMPNGSADVVVYENVVPHQTVESVAKTLDNVSRVLRDDGLLVIGPQTDDVSWENGGWTFLKKEAGELREIVRA